jgi:hypothetical protein
MTRYLPSCSPADSSADHRRLDALGPAPRPELLHVLMLPDLDRVERIGEFWGHPETRTFGELLIDLEEDRRLRVCPAR